MKILTLLLPVWLSISVMGCGGPVDESDLHGSYIARYDFGADSVYLEKRGVFFQRVWLSGDSIEHVASGTWKFDSKSNYISMENKILVVDGFGKLRKDCCNPSKGTSYLPVWRFLFVGRLHIGTDELVPYAKVSED